MSLVKTPEGWMKLNSDGCAARSSGLAGCGGVVQDRFGDWISGFSRRIFVAEL